MIAALVNKCSINVFHNWTALKRTCFHSLVVTDFMTTKRQATPEATQPSTFLRLISYTSRSWVHERITWLLEYATRHAPSGTWHNASRTMISCLNTGWTFQVAAADPNDVCNYHHVESQGALGRDESNVHRSDMDLIEAGTRKAAFMKLTAKHNSDTHPVKRPTTFESGRVRRAHCAIRGPPRDHLSAQNFGFKRVANTMYAGYGDLASMTLSFRHFFQHNPGLIGRCHVVDREDLVTAVTAEEAFYAGTSLLVGGNSNDLHSLLNQVLKPGRNRLIDAGHFSSHFKSGPALIAVLWRAASTSSPWSYSGSWHEQFARQRPSGDILRGNRTFELIEVGAG
ncbi:uncharacterized protein MYCFIDRAFT_179712 [Pseudocercospora fijiensis CIRAD86]|uniref:Uncharacterized protein n=1 Tax=Pseudocercospora fijiensis (strain CIRAD86) TaxID=383855 RepID=M3AJZ1_PSEFD|nr:uncharacterized protein MYCFIDRAFT_179712 [Pseudocercospora fijiensis CIRAD86]EME77493.1 hypothetical protein MYCFIDRAFT_179712 [Pseudocercospora fijiensis CIRAD86]